MGLAALVLPTPSVSSPLKPRAKPHEAVVLAVAGTAVSVSLLFSTPPVALGSDNAVCVGRSGEAVEDVRPESVTNEELVEEAWDVVNQSFLPDAGGRPWSPEEWMQKKQDIDQTRIKSRSRAHEVIRKMLGSLGDPYTRFLSPSEFSKMAKYDITGVGLNLKEVPDGSSFKLKVLGLILDGPAYSVGVRQGDEILTVNGVDVRGKSAFDVSSMLQGPNGTFVTLEVKHDNCNSSETLKVQRQSTARTPVFYRLEKVGSQDSLVGYIQVKEFNALAKRDLVSALSRLQDSGVSYFVIDLRDNLGGLVQAGIEIAKLFLDKGDTVIYTAGRDRQAMNTIVAENSPSITAPLVVLVNNWTASASEIVASALHDNCKAVLVGDHTFGKGLIQSVFELRDGSGIVVTIGKYVTPNHKDINGNGIAADFRRMPDLKEISKRLSLCRLQSSG